MNRTLLMFACALAAGPPVAAQKSSGGKKPPDEFHFVDSTKKLTIRADHSRGDQATSSELITTLKGNVAMHSVSQGLNLNAETVKCTVRIDPHGDAFLQHANAQGGVHLVKQISRPGGTQTTDIRGSTGDLQVLPTGDLVRLAGPVRIQSFDPARAQTMLATGSSAVVTLEHEIKGKFGNGLREGTLEGPVHIDMVRTPVSPGGGGIQGLSHLVATSDRMQFDNAGAQPTVHLMGHVVIHADGYGDVNGLSSAFLRLNQAFEVVSWDGD